MGMGGGPVNMQNTMSKHAFFDLSHVSPMVFVYLLKGCYAYGTCKATAKFRSLQQQVLLVLLNNSHVGPVSFIARCLYILPIYESYHEGFSHLILSALRRFLKIGYYKDEDILNARKYTAELFLDFVGGGSLIHDERVLIKIIEVFEVDLMNIEKVMPNCKADGAKEVVEKYVTELIKLESYTSAIDLLIHFSIHRSGDTLLLKMMESQQFKAAEKWAIYLGKPALCLLVREYVDKNLVEHTYDVIKKQNLREDFPELYLKSKESSLKKLAEKGVWEIAEARANGDEHLLEYLVYLALEAGYSEKVEELCDRYSLKGFFKIKELEANVLQNRYLQLHELLIDDVIWVDNVNVLRYATCYFEECKVIGLDCEWKPNFEKGSKQNKVSILQFASEKKAYIFDLIKLHEDVPSVLDECLSRILHSTSILKLGYNFQCDVKQLSRSYGELNCFKHFEMLLDVQNVFKDPRGGLSGLAEKILGSGLNKTRRNSNWEQRPLSQYQLEYAALDAVVLIHIFRHMGSHTQVAEDGQTKIEWKSYIISHTDSSKSAPKGH